MFLLRQGACKSEGAFMVRVIFEAEQEKKKQESLANRSRMVLSM